MFDFDELDDLKAASSASEAVNESQTNAQKNPKAKSEQGVGFSQVGVSLEETF